MFKSSINPNIDIDYMKIEYFIYFLWKYLSGAIVNIIFLTTCFYICLSSTLPYNNVIDN